MDKHNIEFYTIRPINSIWNWLALPALGIGVCVGFSSFFFLEQESILAVSVFLGFVGYVFLKSRNSIPEARRIYFWFFIPLGLGISLSIFPFSNLIPVIIGGVTAISMYLWLLVLRFPPQYRAALKAYRSGEALQALNLINQAINLRPELWESYQQRSVIHMALYKAIDAERDAQAALRIQPDHFLCHSALGLALLPQQRYAEAKDAFSRALDMAPQYAANHYNKGVACYRLGEFQEAIPYFQFALHHMMPDRYFLLGNYYLGRSLLQVGSSEQAKKAFEVFKKHKASYKKYSESFSDAPDYPSIVMLRHELKDMEMYLV